MTENYLIDSSFRFNGKDILLYGEGEIEIKNDSYIGSYSTIQSVKGRKVFIGEKCSISHNVRMYTQSYNANQDFSKELLSKKSGDVIINDFVWIGANVFICPGVTIGENSIVGANSVVTKDIPPYSIVGGVPAKLIRLKTIK